MSDLEKTTAGKVARGDWVILGGYLSRVATVKRSDGTVAITTDFGHRDTTRLPARKQLSRLAPGADVEAVARRVRDNIAGTSSRYLSSAQVAEEVGVTRSTITTSLRRNGLTSARPFPQPRVYIGGTPGWAPSQLPEIRAWFGQPTQGRARARQPE
ncbi:hypothetical protein GCM10009799_20510 [Nocardiopsis rhodophaea]|uniref:Uncharacterized protein n=1 Tax=Nocardiopsis rhodophaea TaxID=280238 RepID=A0ABP5EBM9_9ACTN